MIQRYIQLTVNRWLNSCANPERFFREGPALTIFFFCLVYEGREDPNTTLSGPSSARQQRWPNIECWCGSLVITRGSGQVLHRNPIIFCHYSGEVSGPRVSRSGSAHARPSHNRIRCQTNMRVILKNKIHTCTARESPCKSSVC